MGAAVWVFGMLSEHIDAEGLVDGGRPLNCATIAAALGVSESVRASVSWQATHEEQCPSKDSSSAAGSEPPT